MTEDDKPYEVGYGKPPRHTRFVKGRSGNPRGRPRKAAPNTSQTDIERLFSEVCGTVQMQGKDRPISGVEGMYLGLIREALRGSVKAAAALFKEEMRLIQPAVERRDSKRSGGLRGYMLVPAIASLDEWEARAMPSQEKLARETREPAYQGTGRS